MAKTEENNVVAMEAMDEVNEGCVEVAKPANNFVGHIISGFTGLLLGIAGTIGAIVIHNKRAAKKAQETAKPVDDDLEDVELPDFDEIED